MMSRLHTFCHDTEAQRVPERDDRRNNGSIPFGTVDIAGEHPIHLQRGQRELAQAGQRGEARSEIIEGKFDPLVCDRLHPCGNCLRIAQQGGFGEFQDQPRPGHVMPLQRLRHLRREFTMGDLQTGDVDRHRQTFAHRLSAKFRRE